MKLDVASGQAEFAQNFNDEPGWYAILGTRVFLASSYTPEEQWSATICTSCESPSVWRGQSLVYPRQSTIQRPHPDMPELAAELYEEARLVLPDSRRAAAALARAALESFLKALDDSGKRKNLQTRLGELDGKINPALWRVLTALRVLGNDSLHDESDELVALYLSGDGAEIVEPIFGALNALVEELITQPRRAEELYNMIPEEKRAAAERAASTRGGGS